jgi:hypothetical protein
MFKKSFWVFALCLATSSVFAAAYNSDGDVCCSNGPKGGPISYNWSDPTLVPGFPKSDVQAARSEAQDKNFDGPHWKALCTAVEKVLPMVNSKPADKC